MDQTLLKTSRRKQAKFTLIAGPDALGNYIIRDNSGRFRFFYSTTTKDLSSKDVVLQDGGWAGTWKGFQW